MSCLIILGNTNEYTFHNSIAAAQAKSIELFGKGLEDIYVFHSQESFDKLFGGSNVHIWLDNLQKAGISKEMFINRIISIDDKYMSFINYIKKVLSICDLDELIVDVTNGTTDLKTLLSIVSYVLEIPHVFLFDTASLKRDKGELAFLNLHEDDNDVNVYYKNMVSVKAVDKLACINLTEIIRYREKVTHLSNVFTKFNDSISSPLFFKENLINAIRLKIQNDNADTSEESLYRIASTAIFASIEDLIDRIFIHFNMVTADSKLTLGNKIHLIQNKLTEEEIPGFDYEFLEMFNNFILYIRNSTTHKAINTSESEKYKAALAIQMSIVFLEYYSTVVYNVLSYKTIGRRHVEVHKTPTEDEEMFYGLDGDNTGKALETLMNSNGSEHDLSNFSKRIKAAKDEAVKYIKAHDGKIVFAEGDDILFKGFFSIDDLTEIKGLYFKKCGLTCSVAYGETVREVLYSMKIAKMNRDTIMGIKLTN